MKTKKKVKTLKLNLNKEKVAELTKESLNQIKGGGTFLKSWCFCPI